MNLTKVFILSFFLNFGFSIILLAENNEEAPKNHNARIKRISLMTQNLEESLNFFTMVIGFTIDFKGTLSPANKIIEKPKLRKKLSMKTFIRFIFLEPAVNKKILRLYSD